MTYVLRDDRIVFSLLSCAPVPSQNRYFESYRESICIWSVLV